MPKIPLVYKKVRIGTCDVCFCRNWIWRPACGNYGYILLYKGSYRGMKLVKNVSGKTISAGSFLALSGSGVSLPDPPPKNKDREKFLKRHRLGQYNRKSEFYRGMS